MTRWQPGAAERLQGAALELFATRGYDETTAAEIAQSVGLTERTFFRYFADKREVLFAGQDEFGRMFLDGLDRATEANPVDLVAAAVQSASAFFPDERRAHSRLRQTVIEQYPALQERERHKLATVAVDLGAALRERGIDEPAATLAAETGVTVFGLAFVQWIRDGEDRPFGVIAAGLFDDLVALTRSASPIRYELAGDG